jgi:hypothetical protein
MNSVPTFKTRDIVDSIRSTIERAFDKETSPSGEEMNAGLRKQFPGISDDQMQRAYAVFREEMAEGLRESSRVLAQVEILEVLAGSIFEGLPDGTTLAEAAKIKAAQGDPVALSYQAHANSSEYRIQCALWEAAVDAHPDWKKHNNRSYRWKGQGEAPSTDSMVDWFQLNHPAQAREIERAIEKG